MSTGQISNEMYLSESKLYCSKKKKIEKDIDQLNKIHLDLVCQQQNAIFARIANTSVDHFDHYKNTRIYQFFFTKSDLSILASQLYVQLD